MPRNSAEWAAMERLCCSFLEIVTGDDGTVRLTGAAGVKEFIAAEFTANPQQLTSIKSLNR